MPSLKKGDAPKKELDIPEILQGKWVGKSGLDYLSAIISNKFMVLQVTNSRLDGTVKAYFYGIDQRGAYVFQFKPVVNISNNNLNQSGSYNLPKLSTGILKIHLRSGFRKKWDGKLNFTFYATMDKHAGYSTELKKAGPPPARRIERGPNFNNGMFLYEDVLSSNKSIYANTDLPTNARNHLLKTVSNLQKSGWNCLNEGHFNVTSNRIYKYIESEYSTSVYIIYSPVFSKNLVCNVSSRRNSFANISTSGDFPMVTSYFIGRGTSILEFWLLPDESGSLNSKYSVPVSVYSFSKGWGDRGEGCEFTQTTTFDYVMALGKLSFAILLENSRKDSNSMEQYFAIYGRDISIESALRDIFRDADDTAIKYMTRNIGNLMQNGFNLYKFFEANTREAIIQEIEKKPGMMNHAARYFDILLDIEN